MRVTAVHQPLLQSCVPPAVHRVYPLPMEGAEGCEWCRASLGVVEAQPPVGEPAGWLGGTGSLAARRVGCVPWITHGLCMVCRGRKLMAYVI